MFLIFSKVIKDRTSDSFKVLSKSALCRFLITYSLAIVMLSKTGKLLKNSSSPSLRDEYSTLGKCYVTQK